MTKAFKFTFAIFCCVTQLGCATYMRTMPGELEADNKVYIGTHEWLDFYSSYISPKQPSQNKPEKYGFLFFGIIDMPLCFITDTLLLPYTITDALLSDNNESVEADKSR